MEDLHLEQSVLKLTKKFVMFNLDDGAKAGAILLLEAGVQNVSNVQVNLHKTIR